MPVISRRAVIALKPEATAGTSAVPDAAQQTESLICYGLTFDPHGGSASAENKPLGVTLAGSLPVPKSHAGSLSFTTHLCGSGTAGTAPDYGKALIAAGFAQDRTAGVDVVYKPTSTNNQASSWSPTADFLGWSTVTIYAWEYDSGGAAYGKLHKFLGCLANVSFSFKVGEIPAAKFDFTGVTGGSSVVTYPQPLFASRQIPLPCRSLTFRTNFNATSSQPKAREIQIDMGNDIRMQTDITTAAKNIAARLVNRKPTMKFVVECPREMTGGSGGDEDWMTAFTAGDTGAVTWSLVGSTGNIVEMSAPNAGIRKVSYADAGGIRVVNAECRLGSADLETGDDELSITVR